MLSDEEKQAIKECDIIFISLDDMISEELANDYRKSYKILKNLLEKQSKEIEELKEKNRHITKETVDFVNSHYISKGRIEAKIKELDDINNEFSQRVIKSKEVYLTEMVQNILKELLEKK